MVLSDFDICYTHLQILYVCTSKISILHQISIFMESDATNQFSIFQFAQYIPIIIQAITETILACYYTLRLSLKISCMFHLKRIWRIILSRVFSFLYLCFHNPISISFCLYFLSCLQRFFTKFQFWIQLITGVIPSQFTFSLCFFADSNFPCMSIFFFFLSSSVVFFVSLFQESLAFFNFVSIYRCVILKRLSLLFLLH